MYELQNFGPSSLANDGAIHYHSTTVTSSLSIPPQSDYTVEGENIIHSDGASAFNQIK
jgi:hypothetical protein